MVDRILLVLKVKNLTASKFADEIGVQRSSISHILSGRNLPSLDFVQKVLKTYPEINSDWLLNGNGPMTKTYSADLFNSVAEDKNENNDSQPDLFASENDKNIEQNAEKELFEDVSNVENTPLELDKSKQVVIKEEILNPEEAIIKDEIIENTKVFSESHKNGPSENHQKMKSSEKQIEKIVIFYNDRTFREYFPE